MSNDLEMWICRLQQTAVDLADTGAALGRLVEAWPAGPERDPELETAAELMARCGNVAELFHTRARLEKAKVTV